MRLITYRSERGDRAGVLSGDVVVDAGELALVFDHLSAQQPYQWTVGYFTDTIPLAPVLGQSSSRDLLVTANSLPGDTAFRCVTSATN